MTTINNTFKFFERYSKYLEKNGNVEKFNVSVRDVISGITSMKWDYSTKSGEGFITAELLFDEELNDYVLDIEEFFLDRRDLVEYEYMKTYSINSINDDIDLSKVSMII